jgi:hypothetical protein
MVNSALDFSSCPVASTQVVTLREERMYARHRGYSSRDNCSGCLVSEMNAWQARVSSPLFPRSRLSDRLPEVSTNRFHASRGKRAIQLRCQAAFRKIARDRNFAIAGARFMRFGTRGIVPVDQLQ